MADEARLHDQIEAQRSARRAEATLGTFDRMAEDEARSGKPGHRFQARSLQALNRRRRPQSGARCWQR